jgi:CBS domain-containing membrane protein
LPPRSELMNEDPGKKGLASIPIPELTDKDIFDAMKAVPGYLDISPGDFKEIYSLAFQQAMDRLSRSVKARDIMTKEVVLVNEDTPIVEVAETMGRKKVSGVPVVDEGGKVLGIISEKDFLMQMADDGPKNVMSLIAQCLQVKKCLALPLRGQTARDIMNSPAITIRPDTLLKDIAELFSTRTINRVPVIDSEGRLKGLITRSDIVRANKLEPKS